MGRDDDAHPEPCSWQEDIGTVEESAARSRFWMAGHFIRQALQSSLDDRKIKQAIVFATGEEAEATAQQIDHYRQIAVLPI
jgi:hypothetical protein